MIRTLALAILISAPVEATNASVPVVSPSVSSEEPIDSAQANLIDVMAMLLGWLIYARSLQPPGSTPAQLPEIRSPEMQTAA